MPLMTIVNLKGSPGATVFAAGLCAHWPEPDRLLVEADLSGGVLAARWRLQARPGLVDVATKSTTQPDLALDAGVQRARTEGGVLQVVCAPTQPLQAQAAIARLLPRAKVLMPADRWVIADLGRIDPQLPTWPLLSRADAVVVVVAGEVSQALALRGMLDELRTECGPRLAVVVAPAVYRADDINSVLLAHGAEIPVLGELPGPETGNRWRRRGGEVAWERLAKTVFEHASPTPALAVPAEPVAGAEVP